MSKAKHTPGKWEISSRSEYTVVQSGLNRSIATTGGYSDNQRSEAVEIENKANARLIAEAPAMYEAIQEFCDRVERGEVRSKRTYTKFKELIKKIEG